MMVMLNMVVVMVMLNMVVVMLMLDMVVVMRKRRELAVAWLLEEKL